MTSKERYQLIYGNTARQVEYGNTARKLEYSSAARPLAEPYREPYKKPEKKREEQRRPKQKQQTKANLRVLDFNGTLAKFMALSVLIVVMTCIPYLYGKSVIREQKQQIARKTDVLVSLKTANQALEDNLEKKVDYDVIMTKATELGMITPTEGNTIYYEAVNDDYVRQYADLPTVVKR